MIDVNIESTELILNKPNELTFWLVNSSNEIVTNVIFSINLPVKILLQSGSKKLEISQLASGQKVKHTIKVVPKAKGKHIIASRNFSYRDALGRGQRIRNLNLEITVIKKETVTPPPKANIEILLRTNKIPLNQWEKLEGIIRNIGSVPIETVILKVVGRIESDRDSSVVSLPAESTYNFSINVLASESGRSVPFSIEAIYKDTFKRTESLIFPQSLQVTKEMESSTNHTNIYGGNFSNTSFNSPNSTMHGTQHIHVSQKKRTLAEAASEIQQLLKQLAETYPTITENEKQIFVTQFDSQVVQKKQRVQKILIEGGIELLKLICPPLGIPIEMGRTWLETAEKSVCQDGNN